MYRSVLSKAAGIATVSRMLQRKFKENTGFDSVVIPNLIQKREDLSYTDSEKIEILTVADLNDEIKNITGLLRAFTKTLNERDDLHLTIIGGGPDQEMIKDLVQQLQINEEVTLRGRLPYDEVLPAYQNCDFFVCNSNFETFGMAVAEALSAGKPVISTKCGGPEEFVNNNNGILVETKNEDELSNAILRMADLYKNYHPKELSKSIQDQYGPEIVKEKLIAFYESAINGPEIVSSSL